MSTSAKIKVENLKVCLYKHWDGYPEATLKWLESFNKDFTKNRGIDPDYKMAQLVRSSIIDADKFELDKSKYTGWGLNTDGNVYGDFVYLLKEDGKVEIIR